MEQTSLKTGIVGCGSIANAHIKGYQQLGIPIVAVNDISSDAMSRAKEELPELKCFDSYQELIDSGEVNMISVCTPPIAHREAVVYALSKGIHVLCEKPLAFDVTEANMVCTAANNGALLMTAFRHRFLPANIKMKELIQEGVIGAPVFFQNIFCGPAFGMKDKWFSKKSVSGGGSLMDTNSHSVDLFRFIIGEVVEQHAVTHTHLEGIDVEDAGILIMKAENGAIGSVTSAWVAGAGAAFIDVMGQKGRLYYDYLVPDQLKLRLTEDKDWKIINVEPSNGFAEQINHFSGAIRGEHPLSCTGHDGLRAVEIIQAVY